MSMLYNEEYYKCYDPAPYSEKEYWTEFFDRIAKHIVDDLHPQTVLDAGCAMGYLVAALRDLGVEAYGIDISEYAVSNVREDIRPYCVVGSITEDFPGTIPNKYDLIVSIEVLEHLYEDDGLLAIQNFCKHTETVIFSSTPDDIEDKTHFNVQQREYWAKRFAQFGFYDDLTYRPLFLTDYSVCYRKTDNQIKLIESYERTVRQTEKELNQCRKQNTIELQKKDKHIENLEAIIDAHKKSEEDSKVHIRNLSAEIDEEKRTSAETKEANKTLLNKIENLQCSYAALMKEKNQLMDAYEQEHEKCRMCSEENEQLTSAIEKEQDRCQMYSEENTQLQQRCETFKQELDEKEKECIELSKAYAATLYSTSWKLTKPIRLIKDLLTGKKLKKSRLSKVSDALYDTRELIDTDTYRQQKKECADSSIKISIVTPLYNTPEKFLVELLKCVQNQTYANWELCLADGSDEKHTYVRKICCRIARKDRRIKYKRLKKNSGISENTNEAISMTTGDYIALLDHDDLIHPSALYEAMKAITGKNADFVYTDEAVFSDTPNDAFDFHYKPDYAPDTLRSYNYICHLSVFSRDIFNNVGGFNSEYDGSQDYDMVLRLSEYARKIIHIPQVLYYWRAHVNSSAQNVLAKPYTMDAAKKAILAHMNRIGLEGDVSDSSIPTTYRVKYALDGAPLVSIIIPNKDHVLDLERCIESIRNNTTYGNWEIVIVENNSTDEATEKYYRELEADDRICVARWKSGFNYPAINNFGVKFAKGEYIVLLNNDTEVITPDWIQEMLMFAQRKDVGAVGAMLYYPDDTVQHAGVILGIGGVAGHSHKGYKRGDYGYMSRLTIAQNLSAVTAACMMVRKDVWTELKGLDEAYAVAFNDVDFCMRIRQAGYNIVWTPYAELYHFESKSRGYEDTEEKQKRFAKEVKTFQNRWGSELEKGDPYYNPNLTLEREDFSVISQL